MREPDRPSPAGRRLAVAALALVLLAAAPGVAASRPAYTTTPAPYAAQPQFAIAYSGTGDWLARHRATHPARRATASGSLAPRPGRYTGPVGGRPGFVMHVASRRVQIVAFPFACRGATGRTSLTDIGIRRIYGTYRFAIRSHGIVTYSDGRPDENAAVAIRGTFARSGTAVAGRLTVRTPRCGVRRDVRWSARRR